VVEAEPRVGRRDERQQVQQDEHGIAPGPLVGAADDEHGDRERLTRADERADAREEAEEEQDARDELDAE
jgi:hypothetical protein